MVIIMSKLKEEKKEKFKSKIGGQAVIEGVMMLGPNKRRWLVACRTAQLTLKLRI